MIIKFVLLLPTLYHFCDLVRILGELKIFMGNIGAFALKDACAKPLWSFNSWFVFSKGVLVPSGKIIKL